MSRRIQLVVLAAVTAATALTASAATLGGLSSSTLAAGGSDVAGCDADGVTIIYTTSAGAVTNVTIGGIADPGCEGGSLAVTLVDGTNASVASAAAKTIPADGDTTDNALTIAVSPTAAADSVAAYHVSITGP